MSIRVSELAGKEIYDTEGEYIGKSYDLIMNMERGEALRIMTSPLKRVKAEQLEETIKKNSIMYSRVRNVRDIIVVEKGRYH